MKYMWYVFWCFYVASSALWSGPDDPSSTESEILNVESLEGRSGFFRGFMWQKQNDTFYITSVRSGPRQCLASQEEIDKYLSYQEFAADIRRDNRENCGRDGIAMLREDGQWTLASQEEIEIYRAENERLHAPADRIRSNPETAVMTLFPRAGNLRINHPTGTVILDNVRLAGDLIVAARRVKEMGLIHSHNFITLSCERIPGPCIVGSPGGSWEGMSERKVSNDEDFIPYSGHHLIAGR